MAKTDKLWLRECYSQAKIIMKLVNNLSDELGDISGDCSQEDEQTLKQLSDKAQSLADAMYVMREKLGKMTQE